MTIIRAMKTYIAPSWILWIPVWPVCHFDCWLGSLRILLLVQSSSFWDLLLPIVSSEATLPLRYHHVRILFLLVGPCIRLVVNITRQFIPSKDSVMGSHYEIDFRTGSHGD